MGFANRQEIIKQPKKNIRVINDANNYRELNKRIKKSNSKKAILFSGLCICMIGLTILLLMRFTQITELNAELSKINAEVVELETKRDYLITKLEPYKATARIESLAKINLGMDYPKTQQHVKIESGYNEVQVAKTETNNMETFKSFFSALFGVFSEE